MDNQQLPEEYRTQVERLLEGVRNEAATYKCQWENSEEKLVDAMMEVETLKAELATVRQAAAASEPQTAFAAGEAAGTQIRELLKLNAFFKQTLDTLTYRVCELLRQHEQLERCRTDWDKREYRRMLTAMFEYTQLLRKRGYGLLPPKEDGQKQTLF